MIEFCGIPLAHRVINGSGTFDAIAARRAFGDAIYEHFPFAAFVSKTVTLEPRQGNPPPRLWELAGGMINSIGLPNKGLHGYLAEDLPKLAELPVPLIVNVMGSTREDVARLVGAFSERDEVSAIELNVSCPNVKTGLVMGADPQELAALLDAVRPISEKPLIVKLTPNCAVARRRRRGRRAARGGRCQSHQHAARDGHGPRPAGTTLAWGRDWRGVRAGGPRDRPGPGSRGPRTGRAADRGDGRGPVRSPCRRSASSGRRSGRRRH